MCWWKERSIPSIRALGYDAIHSIGVFGLAPLTGVRQNDLHDGSWWRAWWEKNKEKYPKEIREQKFPIRVRAPEEPEEK
ncbi:MAG TPA: hypothetical protein VGJ26_10310 [Pirellulales bacterium]